MTYLEYLTAQKVLLNRQQSVENVKNIFVKGKSKEQIGY